MGGSFTKSMSDETNLETFSLIWLDAQVNRSKGNVEAQEQLRKVINQLKTFDDGQLCENYIQSLSENNRIVFMSSGQLGKEIVPRIHHLRQVFSIYIFCMNKEKYEELAEQYIKVQGVFTVLSELIDRIRTDQDRRKHNRVDEQLSISIFNTKYFEKQWKSESNDHFIYSQILIDCLLRIPITLDEENDLMSLCKTEYKENKDELKVISEFERYYSSDRAIWWYTRYSFLYKMLTKALRIQNIDLLFLFRNVIYDIQCQLEEKKYLSSICVYRGQLMSKVELETLKDSLKEFISINSFLSAVPDRKSALLFLMDSIVSDDIERVLFEIHAQGDLDDVKAFTNIGPKSYYKQEEIFFSIGSIFQLIDIRLGEDKLWIIQMKLCTNNHSQLKPIFEHIEKQYGDTKTSLLPFGSFLQKMNKFDEAEKYYRLLINLLPRNHKSISICQNAIKTIPIDKENYEKALKSMGKTVEIYMESSKMNDSHLAFSYSNMGETYRNNGDLKRALESYEKALNIWKKSFSADHQEAGRCYNNMGLIYQENEEYEKALEYHQKAKTILEKYLSGKHPDLSAIYSYIGDIHQILIQYDQALDNYQKSLEIAEQVFTSKHPSSISLMKKIAAVYEEKKDFQQALVYYGKIAASLPFAHADVVKNNQNIQRISSQLK